MDHLSNFLNKCELVHCNNTVNQAIDNMAQQITNDLSDKKPLMLCVVNGGIYIMGQLMARLKFELEIDYVHASRYQDKLVGNELKWYAKPNSIIKGRNIAIVDDVIDQGLTIKSIADWCLSEGATSVYSIVLVDKTPCRLPAGLQKANCSGLTTGDDYIFGCGLDVKGLYRNLPAIYAVPKVLIPELDTLLPS